MVKKLSLMLCVAAMLAFAGLVRADSIDDAEAKRRGVPVPQVQAENALAREKQKTVELEKQVAELQKQIADLKAGKGAAASMQASAATASAPARVDKETWMAKPAAQWPQIHLANDVKLTQNRTMVGASASLIKLDDGRIFGVTARHLMGPLGGINPALKLNEIDANVQSWFLRSNTAPQPQVRLGKLATKLEDEGQHDCLIFATTGDLSKLPGLALKPRLEPLRAGDNLYLLGCPYTQTPYRQNAYPGTVVENTATGETNFRLDADLVTRGFSGAPVIDENGHFAGVYSGHMNQKPDGSSRDVYMVTTTTVLELITKK